MHSAEDAGAPGAVPGDGAGHEELLGRDVVTEAGPARGPPTILTPTHEMTTQGKQCAACGAPMGAQGRECPRCGQSSLFGNSGLLAFLVVLLVGIALASGLIPMDRFRAVAVRAPADKVSTPLQPTPLQSTSVPVHRAPSTPVSPSAKAPSSAQAPRDTAVAYTAPDPHAEEVAQVVSVAQCARPDLALIRQLLEEPGQTDLDSIAARACAAAASKIPEGAQFITPQRLTRPDSTSGSAQP
jgi:hypothetical protein